MSDSEPQRGFPDAEFQARVAKAQHLMGQRGLDALVLTCETDVRYFSGYLTRFWESPTRPWFLIVPASGAPVAVIPSIGAALMAQTWVRDIRTWSSPYLEDDGLSLLCDTLAEVTPEHARIGLPDGPETHVRMPWADLQRLAHDLGARSLTGDQQIVRDLRRIKSSLEVDKIRAACAVAARAFRRVPEIAGEGVPLDRIFRQFQMLCLQEGADWVPYLAGGAEQGGYSDVISPARPVPLQQGDVLMLDTGLVWDGYFCDYDRNWSVGPVAPPVADAYKTLIDATDAAAAIARPGYRAADLFHAMNDILSKGAGATDAGRLGHGLGMSLTEWPSFIPADDTLLAPGMVLTLEPGIALNGRILVHEEDILITEGAPEFLSPRATAEMQII